MKAFDAAAVKRSWSRAPVYTVRMKRLMILLSLVCAAPAFACDCQKQQPQAAQQCNCAGQSCPGECGNHANDAQKPKPKPDKKKTGTSAS